MLGLIINFHNDQPIAMHKNVVFMLTKLVSRAGRLVAYSWMAWGGNTPGGLLVYSSIMRQQFAWCSVRLIKFNRRDRA